jgi:dCMP deaminase
MNFDEYFMRIAETVSMKSKDTSRKCGCVIVGPDNEIRSTGYNDHVRGIIDSPERRERPEKYYWTEHAERNALFNAARAGISTNKCRAYIYANPDLFSCYECTRGLIQSGIVKIICDSPPDFNDPIWGEGFKRTFAMLTEAEVQISYMKNVRESNIQD